MITLYLSTRLCKKYINLPLAFEPVISTANIICSCRLTIICSINLCHKWGLNIMTCPTTQRAMWWESILWFCLKFRDKIKRFLNKNYPQSLFSNTEWPQKVVFAVDSMSFFYELSLQLWSWTALFEKLILW